MLKINKKNEVFRVTLYKKIYFKIALTILLKIFYKKLKKKLNIRMAKYLRNLHPQLFVQNNCTKVRSICILTGRSRSVYRAFKMSRLKLREYASQGYFNGISKASW